MPNYGDAKYWDDRYTQQKNTTFDWLEGWDDIAETLEKFAIEDIYEKTEEGELKIRSEAQCKEARERLKILNLGCGNSIMCEEMYDAGYPQIWNMDISSVCIEQMRQRNKDRRPTLKWDVMDCRDLGYATESFDLVIDKSTIDALLCGNCAYLNVGKMMKECQRVLKTGGYYIAVSYGIPENREFHFMRQHLKFELRTYKLSKQHKDSGAPTIHYIYICKKLPGADEQAEANWSEAVKEIELEMEGDGDGYDSSDATTEKAKPE